MGPFTWSNYEIKMGLVLKGCSVYFSAVHMHHVIISSITFDSNYCNTFLFSTQKKKNLIFFFFVSWRSGFKLSLKK